MKNDTSSSGDFNPRVNDIPEIKAVKPSEKSIMKNDCVISELRSREKFIT